MCLAVEGVERLNEFSHALVCRGVVLKSAAFFTLNESLQAHPAQELRELRLGKTTELLKLTHCFFSTHKMPHDE